MDGKMTWGDASLSIKIEHLRPIDTPVRDIYICLNIEHSCYASFLQLIYILLCLRVLTQPNFSVSNLIESHRSYEVSVCLFDVAIDEKNFIDIFPLIVALLTQLTSVRNLVRILDIDIPTGFSLPNCVIHLIVSN